MTATALIRSVWARTEVVGSRRARAGVVLTWALRRAEDRCVDRWIYRRLGARSEGPSFGDQLVGDDLTYVPTEWRSYRRLLAPEMFTTSDVVLEYGCGKGRTQIWLMSRCELRRVVGIDHAAALVSAARANVDHWRGARRTDDIAVVEADARDYPVPDDVSVVFLFNPFVGQTFRQMVQRLQESLARAPRRLRVVYRFPLMHEELIGAGFTVTHLYQHIFYSWASYEWLPGNSRGETQTTRERQ